MTADGIQYFLNPIYRSNGSLPSRSVRAAEHIMIHHRFNYLLAVILMVIFILATSFIYLRKYYSSEYSPDYIIH